MDRLLGIRILNYILLFLYRTTSGGAGPRNNSFNTNSIQKINTSHPGERQSFRTTRLNATASSLSPASDDPDLIPLQTSTKNLQLGKLKLIFPSKKNLFSSGFEPETFRVLGGCDNQLHHENAWV